MSFTPLVVDIGSPEVGSHRYQTGSGQWYDFASDQARKDNTLMLQNIAAQYGAVIARFADALGIPRGIVAGFIATESGGRMTTRPGSAFKGLMQCAAGPFYDCFVKWQTEVKSEPIPQVVIKEVSVKCPELLTHSASNYKPNVLNAKLSGIMETDASFNVMAGCLILRWNLERFAGSLNKAIVAYNAGTYNKAISSGSRAITTPTDTAALVQMPKLSAESKGYLKKMLGVGSYLAIVYRDKTVQI